MFIVLNISPGTRGRPSDYEIHGCTFRLQWSEDEPEDVARQRIANVLRSSFVSPEELVLVKGHFAVGEYKSGAQKLVDRYVEYGWMAFTRILD